jgi:hypothetical protein
MQRAIDGQPAYAAVEDANREMGTHPQIAQITQIRRTNEKELATKRHKKHKNYPLICSCAFCASLWLVELRFRDAFLFDLFDLLFQRVLPVWI